MKKLDKKIEDLKSLHKLLENLKPDREYINGLNEISKQIGYEIPSIVAKLLQCKKDIDSRFLDVFLGYELLTLSQLSSLYSQKDNEELFFRAFQIDSNYDTKPEFEFQLYRDPESHDEEEELIKNIRHLLPLFCCQGEYIALNLMPDKLGELVSLSFDYSATVIAPNVDELIQDTIGGLEQGVFKLDEYNDVISPSNWYLRQQVRDGLLEMDEYGEIVYEDASKSYTGSELEERRIFKTPVVVPITAALMVFIYLGYFLFYLSGGELGILERVKGVVFEVFILASIGIIATSMYNAKLLQSYFIQNPVISNPSQIEELKPVVRSNMYSALLVLFLLAVGAICAVMSLIHEDWPYKIIVMLIGAVTQIVLSRFNAIEERIKNISVSAKELEPELNSILQCWMHKPFPNF